MAISSVSLSLNSYSSSLVQLMSEEHASSVRSSSKNSQRCVEFLCVDFLVRTWVGGGGVPRLDNKPNVSRVVLFPGHSSCKIIVI